jgi:hypothetical protein
MKTHQYTPAEKKLRHYYHNWKEKQRVKGITPNISMEEFYKLWHDSGKIELRGSKPMQYYLHYDVSLPVITIADCEIRQWIPDSPVGRNAVRHCGFKQTPRHISEKERKTCKWGSPLEAEIGQYYSAWSRHLISTGENILVTRLEYVKLWVDSGLWPQRGPSAGDATLKFTRGLPQVTIDDCSIVVRECLSKTPKPPKPPKEVKVKREKIPKPPKEKKPRSRKDVVYKPKYTKTPEQFAKELARAKQRLEEEKAKMKQDESDVAVEMFYNSSNNPINHKIREIAAIQPSNYKAYNVRTGQELRPDPKVLAKYS